MLYLAVCPYHTRTKEGIQRWRKIAKDISYLTGEEIFFEPFKDFQDELQKLKTQTFHIYYANLRSARELLKKGYKVLGTNKDEKDKGILLKRTSKKLTKHIKIASVRSPILTFLPTVSFFDLRDVEILLFNSFNQAIDALREGLVDLTFVDSQTYKNTKKEKWFEEFACVDLPSAHFFMIHPDIEDKIAKAIVLLPYVEQVKAFEFQYAIAFDNIFQSLLETTEGIQIKKSIDNSPYIMHLIHKDTIVYANETFFKTLGYKSHQVINTHFTDYLDDEKLKEKIKKNIQKHMKGEKQEVIYPSVKLLAKDKSARYFNIYCSSILYDGTFSAYMLCVDVTREKKLEILKNLLHKVNMAISGSLSEVELYRRVCKAIVDDVGLKLAWVGAPGEDKWFTVLCSYGSADDYLEGIKIPEGRGIVGKCYNTGEVAIVDDTRSSSRSICRKQKAIEKGYLSVAAVPLRKKGKVTSVLCMYAGEPNFFDEETKEILKQLSKDLSLHLDFVEQLKNYTIISTALEASDTWVMVTDTDGRILYVNDAVVSISGYSKEELIGKNPRIFKSGYQSKNFYKQLWETILTGKETESIFVNKSKSGETFYLHQRIIPVTLPDGTKRFVSVGKDITKEHHMSEEIKRLHYHDPLTGFYSYLGFDQKLQDILPNTKKAFFVLLDIHNMSFVNYTHGVKQGDFFLKEIAQKLRENLGNSVIIGRLRGDEFGILIPTENLKDLSLALDAVEDIFKKPIPLGKEIVSVSYNASVTVYPEHGKNFDELYEHATALLREAKSKGEGVVLFYEKSIFEQIQCHMHTKNLIKRALEESLFVFHYQPYYDLRTMQIAGLEALVRMKLPDGSLLSPTVFIKELEEGSYKDLIAFEEWAIQYLAEKAIELKVLLSVNVSARTFSKRDAVIKLLNIKDRLKSCDATLLIEITERAVMELDPLEFVRTVELLKSDSGNFRIKIAIDDFGTGYSALSYIRDIPADVVKLDMSFIRGIDMDNKSKVFLKHLIALLKALGYKTLIEGVETQAQLDALKEVECDYVQGYFLCKPMPEEEIKELIGLTNKH